MFIATARRLQDEILRCHPVAGQHAEDPRKTSTHIQELLTGRLVKQVRKLGIAHGSRLRGDHRRRHLLAQAPAGARQRQAVNEHEMFDAKDPLDVGTPVDPGTGCRLGDAKIGKFGFPGTKDVRLHVGKLTDFLGPEQWAIGNDWTRHRREV